MFQTARQSALSNRLKSNHGQSLIIALAVMFVMVSLGTIFVTLVSRNLFAAFRSGDVLVARQMAEAGISYADRMLSYGEEGADWRPEPANLDPTAHSNHPDIRWLQPYEPIQTATGGPTGGFTSYTSGEGRFLIRVSYDPNPLDPSSRYLKIESIGRAGFVDSNFLGTGTPDPTTYAATGPVRLRHELTAYKPIGITDYARFVTNRNKRVEIFNLGRTFGPEPFSFGGTIIGQERTGPIRVNGNLVWRGNNDLYLGSVTTQDGERLAIHRVEVAGEITHDSPDSVIRVFNNGTPQGVVVPTRDGGVLNPNFTTFGGLYRDGIDQSDAAGYARAVRRMEPPLIDQEDPSSGVSRYRRLTLNTGFSARLNGGRYVNSARYGYGRGLYIDNSNDVQRDGSTVFGGVQTLSTEWTTPNNKGNWRGSFYVPPGVIIRINPDETLTITRTDIVRRGQKYTWHRYDSANNNLITDSGLGPVITLPYPENGVVFAEGNIRISGRISSGRQLTVVSNENIYIEGNILKGNNTSAISLLARKNVVVNTTQFLSLPPLSTALWESVPGRGLPPYAYRVGTSPSTNFAGMFDFGDWYNTASRQPPTAYPSWDGGPVHLFVRHASSEQTASVNLFVNGAPYDFGGGVFNYLMPDRATQFSPVFEGQVFPLTFGGAPGLDGNRGAPNYLQIGLHQTGFEQSRGDYLLQAIAVVPMDINIQALCYAQEGSFFVIPGPWFNSNPADHAGNGPLRPAEIKHPAFPRHGEPLDIRIVIDGAVVENLPASAGDVDLWMSRWSNIPPFYGSSSQPTVHAGKGITFVYDPLLGFPVLPDGSPIRYDDFGRPLPITPKLPVSPDLIYVGRMSS